MDNYISPEYLDCSIEGALSQNKVKVISVSGEAGTGKTTLIENHKSLKLGIGDRAPFIYAIVGLDGDYYNSPVSIPDLFWAIRSKLTARGIQTASFDLLYSTYFSYVHPGQSISLSDAFGDITKKIPDAADPISEALKFCEEVSPSALKLLLKGVSTVVRRSGKILSKNEAEKVFESIRKDLPLDQFDMLAPKMLAYDIDLAQQNQNGCYIVLALDGFERLQQKIFPLGNPYESALLSLFNELDNRYKSRGGDKNQWSTNIIISGRYPVKLHSEMAMIGVNGFNIYEAELYLKKASDADDEIYHGNIAHYKDLILKACLLQEPENKYLPYALSLCVLILKQKAERFVAAHIGENLYNLSNRFLKYVGQQELDLLELVALIPNFSQLIYIDLIRNGYIRNLAVQDLDREIQNKPYIYIDRSIALECVEIKLSKFMQEAVVEYVKNSTLEIERLQQVYQYLLRKYYKDINALVGAEAIKAEDFSQIDSVAHMYGKLVSNAINLNIKQAISEPETIVANITVNGSWHALPARCKAVIVNSIYSHLSSVQKFAIAAIEANEALFKEAGLYIRSTEILLEGKRVEDDVINAVPDKYKSHFQEIGKIIKSVIHLRQGTSDAIPSYAPEDAWIGFQLKRNEINKRYISSHINKKYNVNDNIENEKLWMEINAYIKMHSISLKSTKWFVTMVEIEHDYLSESSKISPATIQLRCRKLVQDIQEMLISSVNSQDELLVRTALERLYSTLGVHCRDRLENLQRAIAIRIKDPHPSNDELCYLYFQLATCEIANSAGGYSEKSAAYLRASCDAISIVNIRRSYAEQAFIKLIENYKAIGLMPEAEMAEKSRKKYLLDSFLP